MKKVEQLFWNFKAFKVSNATFWWGLADGNCFWASL